MKIVLATLCLLSSGFAFAQTKKMVVPATMSSTPVYTGSTANEITGNLGMTGGGFNLGATYVKPNTDYGFGGYFFYQTSKDKNSLPTVTQVTAFGALMKVNVLDSRNIRAYLAPGFGMAMLKDASINTTTGKKSDENVIGPTLKIGVQFKISSRFMIGIERMEFSNWFNDNVNFFAPGGGYFAAAGTFEF